MPLLLGHVGIGVATVMGATVGATGSTIGATRATVG